MTSDNDQPSQLTSSESYDPNRLLDHLIEFLHLKNDAQLARTLDVGPPVISKIRHKRLPIGAAILIRMHEETGLNIANLRELMGDRRRKYRASDTYTRPATGSQGQSEA